MGIHKRFITATNQKLNMNETKTDVQYFFDEADEAFPMSGYEGTPEFELFPTESYNVKDESEIPSITFKTNQGTDELGPEMDKTILFYQRYIWEMEPWSIFRTLPSVLHYDNAIHGYFKGLQQGLIQIPNYTQDINPPSLWAYYHTLPTWAR